MFDVIYIHVVSIIYNSMNVKIIANVFFYNSYMTEKKKRNVFYFSTIIVISIKVRILIFPKSYRRI